MKDLILEIFGEYSPVTYSVPDGAGGTVEYIASGAAGVDWSFIGGVAIFCVCLIGIFSLLRVVFKK